MTKLNVPLTEVTERTSPGFLKYYVISAVLGFLVVASACFAWRLAA
jgi:hypothetical protein